MSFIYEEPSFKQGHRFILNKYLVKDSLKSLTVANSNLGLLHFGNVIVRRDYATYEYVKIISGGPSGHEPAHAGYVGKGMLTAAIQGDIFVAPCARDILRALREITFKQKTSGVILIIPHQLGTSLNFTIAAQKASNEGINVHLLPVKDYVSHPTGFGSTGIILLQKIAGALSETGMLMNNIYDYCQGVSNNLYTVMVTLKPCKSPLLETCICMRHFGPNDLEIGGGYHGEFPGEKLNISSVKEVCELLIEELTENPNKQFVFDSAVPLIILINNLGNTSLLEQQLFVKEFVQCVQNLDVKILRLYTGHYMTSLDTAGFTVTILRVTDGQYLELLDAPTEAPNWVQPKTLELDLKSQEIIKARVRNKRRTSIKGPALSESQANLLMLALQFSCDALLSCEKQMNLIDSESSDGDTGTRIKSGVEAIQKEIKEKTIDFVHPFNFLIKLSEVFECTICGTLGCIYSIFFEASANSFLNIPETEVINAEMWLNAFTSAIEALHGYLNVEPGGHTMLDPLHASVTIVRNCFDQKMGLIKSLDAGLCAAETAVQDSKSSKKKFPDSGAHVVGIWMRAVFEAIKLRYD